MSKTKMRCNVCGKWFQSANAKDLTCPDCTQKARKEKLAAKQAPSVQGQTAPGAGTPPRQVPPPPKPKSTTPGGTSHWLDAQNDVKIGQPDQPTRPKIPSSPTPRENRGGQERSDQYGSGPGGYHDRDERGPGGPGGTGSYREGNTRGPGGYRDRDERGPGGPGGYREGGYRGPGGYRENDYRGPSNYRNPAPYRVGGGMGLPDTVEQRPRQPMTGNRPPRPAGPGEGREGRPDKFRPGGKPGMQKGKKPSKPKAETPPKPKREKIPPPEPFKPTDEQIAQVENRYLELAVPTEFDGIRTQIAHELNIPKTAVKKIVKNLRDRDNIPSWWEIQTYKGTEEELEKIKAVYEPYLPLPPVGVHKQIAEQLELKPGEVYQAIKKIRLDMNLPQYNDPALHGLVLRSAKKDEQSKETVPAEQSDQDQPQSSDQSGSTEPLAEAQKQSPAQGSSTEPLVEEQKSATDQPVPTEPLTEEPRTEGQQSDTDQPVLVMPTSTASVLQAEQPGEFSSIETDVKFRQAGDTTEVVGAATQDNAPGES